MGAIYLCYTQVLQKKLEEVLARTSPLRSGGKFSSLRSLDSRAVTRCVILEENYTSVSIAKQCCSVHTRINQPMGTWSLPGQFRQAMVLVAEPVSGQMSLSIKRHVAYSLTIFIRKGSVSYMAARLGSAVFRRQNSGLKTRQLAGVRGFLSLFLTSDLT